MLVSEETGALQAIVYMLFTLVWTRSILEVRGRFQSRLRSLYYLWISLPVYSTHLVLNVRIGTTF